LRTHFGEQLSTVVEAAVAVAAAAVEEALRERRPGWQREGS
jgi:hypothetical protein